LNRTGLFDGVPQLLAHGSDGDALPSLGLLYVDLDGFSR